MAHLLKRHLGVRIRVEESALRLALDDVQALHNVRFLLNKVMYVNERQHHSEATKIARGLSKTLGVMVQTLCSIEGKK